MLQSSLLSYRTANTLQYTAALYNTLQHAAAHCNTLRQTPYRLRVCSCEYATHCNILQHACCNVMPRVPSQVPTCCRALHCFAVCCSVSPRLCVCACVSVCDFFHTQVSSSGIWEIESTLNMFSIVIVGRLKQSFPNLKDCTGFDSRDNYCQ